MFPLAKRTAIVHGAFKGCENDSTVVTRDSRDQYFRLESRNTFGAKSGGADDLTAEQRLGAVERGKLGTGLFRTETPEVNPKLVSRLSRLRKRFDAPDRPGTQSYSLEIRPACGIWTGALILPRVASEYRQLDRRRLPVLGRSRRPWPVTTNRSRPFPTIVRRRPRRRWSRARCWSRSPIELTPHRSPVA